MSNITPGSLIALGVLVGLVSTCVQSIGLTLQRKSHMLEDEKEDHESRLPPYRRRRWQIGMLMFLLANIIGSSIQITTLPLPLLSTLQASGLVFNSILATLLLKEAWTRRTGVGTVLVAAGAVLISFFSALPEPSHNLVQLLELFQEPSFLIWFILSLVFVAAVLVMDFSLRKCITQHRAESARIRLIRGMSYGLVSGILSAHALLLAKSAVELIVTSVVKKDNQFRGYQSWIMLVVFLVLALSQLYYLHLGLKLISTSILYPFVFCIYNIVAILDGLIYFRQMDRLPPLHAGLIALGTVILLSGVLALSWRLEEGNDPEHPQMSQAEIPQTLLAPGSGFVADPADDDTNESAMQTDEDEENERTTLLSRPRVNSVRASNSRSSRSPRGSQVGRRRKRAATLKELSVIWHQPGDEEEQAYGTFDGSTTDNNTRPSSAGHQRQRRHRRMSSGRTLESSDDEADLEGSIQRSKTAPARRRSASGAKKRRKSGHEGGALFSDMLKRDWWRAKRRDEDDDEDDGEEPAAPPRASSHGGRRVSSAPHL